MLHDLEILLGNLVAQPDAQISTFKVSTENERRQMIEREKSRWIRYKRFKEIKPKAYSSACHRANVIRIGYLQSDQTTPLVIYPAMAIKT